MARTSPDPLALVAHPRETQPRLTLGETATDGLKLLAESR